MVTKKDINSSDIIFPDSDEKPFFARIDVEDKAATVSQCLTHAMQRHGGQTVKTAVDLSKEAMAKLIKDFKENPLGTFGKGLGWRATCQLASAFPGLEVRNLFKEKFPEAPFPIQAGVSAGVESLLGTPLEVESVKSILRGSGVEMSKTPLDIRNKPFNAAVFAAFVPFMLRNYAAWNAAFIVLPDGKEPSMGQRFVMGSVAGVLSVPFDTIGNMMMHSAAKASSSGGTVANAVKTAAVQSFKDILSDPKKFSLLVAKGSPFRAIPGGIAALIFSDSGKKGFLEANSFMYDLVTKTIPTTGQEIADIFNEGQKFGRVKEVFAKSKPQTSPKSCAAEIVLEKERSGERS